MSLVREVRPGIDLIGAIDWDRRLFDELIPLPEGTSYNSYLVRGKDKTALIDAVDGSMKQKLMDNLDQLNVEHIDYIVCNHAEQDHSGALPDLLKRYKDCEVLASKKGCDLLLEFSLAPSDKISAVNDSDVIPLGGATLHFMMAPWVHWPDTMFTYIPEEKILFSCDFLGSHKATSDLYFRGELEPAKRYFAEIMMPFRGSIRTHLKRLREMDIDIVAPSHGPLHDRPETIMHAYDDWASDDVKNEVVLPFISMHGSTLKMVDFFTDALIDRGITVKRFNLTKTDLGALAVSLVDAATLVVGVPTVLTGPHPAVIGAVATANALRPKTKFASIIGSYGWGGKMVNDVQAMMSNLKVDILDPVIAKGYPKPTDFEALESLADKILEKHKGIGLI